MHQVRVTFYRHRPCTHSSSKQDTSLVPRCRERGGEKGAPGVYCTRMCVNFQKFLENHITCGHLRYTDLCEVADFYCVEMHTTTMLCVNDDKGAMKALSFSVARMIHTFVHSS